MNRRYFGKLCGALMAGATSVGSRSSHALTPYPSSRLIHADGSSVTLDSLDTGIAYIFGYPYVTTPCFLVRLSESSPAKGSWPGGIDTDQTVVAFSAICSHKMSHPAKPISHIAYRAKPVSFYDSTGQKRVQSDVISCCSERSVYDPVDGAKVLSGPAPVPLAAIELRVSNNNEITAEGSYGPDQYERFLNKFGFRLAMEYGVSDVRALSGESCEVIPADQFSSQQVLC